MPDFAALITVCSNLEALLRVLTNVIITPLSAKILAMSTMGIMWPCARSGTNTK